MGYTINIDNRLSQYTTALPEESIDKLMKEYNDKKEELEFYKNTTNKDI